jgi:uncharacterized membrane protein YhhN
MQESFARLWSGLAARLNGPLKLRLLLQPLMAVLLALRAGLRDARAGRPPFLAALLSDRGHRWEHLQRGWADVGQLFLLATVVDVAFQLIVRRTFRPWEAAAVAALLALLPYLLLTGPANRIGRWRAHRRADVTP